MAVDWESWAKHVNYVVATDGYWIGLCDGDGSPVMDLPALVSGQEAAQWMSAPDIAVTIPRAGLVAESQAADLLVKRFVDNLDSSGRFQAADDEDWVLGLAVRGPAGGVRRTACVITHATQDETGDLVTIHAENIMKVWETWPCPSWPLSWWETNMSEFTTDESQIPYTTPRMMTLVEMATVIDGYARRGPAESTIREIVQESLDVAARTQPVVGGGVWLDDPYHVVDCRDNGRESPEVIIRLDDSTLWETLAARAQQAGVLLGARVWWPGDPPVRCYAPATSDMTPEQVNLRGPHRPIEERVFPHAMIVLTVDQMEVD